MKDDKDPTSKLIEAYLLDKKIDKFSENDLIGFFKFVGVTEDLAKLLSNDTLSYWNSFSEPLQLTDFRYAVNSSLQTFNLKFPDILLNQNRAHGERNITPPTQLDPTELEQGTVRRGKRGEDGPSSDLRPHIYLWFEKNRNDPCQEYQWVQFVHPSLWIGRPGEELQNKTSSLSRREKTIESGTGLDVTFCEWNPDYQKALTEKDEKITGKEKPTFHPPGDEFDDDLKSKPYYDWPIPGTNGRTGLIDSPDWGSRGRDKNGKETPSPIERMWRRAGNRDKVRREQRPPNGSEIVEIRMEFRSYLVCLDNMECLGYVSWTATTRATINYEWKEHGTTLGMGKREWKTMTRISDIEYRLEIGDWTPC